jgi:hypothetical protein
MAVVERKRSTARNRARLGGGFHGPGLRGRRLGVGRLRVRDHEGMHGLGDVLHGLRADVAEEDRYLVDDLLLHRARDADATRQSKALEASRDIDAVAEKVAIALDDVAERNPDAENHASSLRERGVASRERLLDVHGGPHGFDRRIELGENRIACRVEDAPAPPAHEIREDLAVFHEPLQGAILILGDEPAIAADIGGHDDGDLAPQAAFIHGLTAILTLSPSIARGSPRDRRNALHDARSKTMIARHRRLPLRLRSSILQ